MEEFSCRRVDRSLAPTEYCRLVIHATPSQRGVAITGPATLLSYPITAVDSTVRFKSLLQESHPTAGSSISMSEEDRLLFDPIPKAVNSASSLSGSPLILNFKVTAESAAASSVVLLLEDFNSVLRAISLLRQAAAAPEGPSSGPSARLIHYCFSESDGDIGFDAFLTHSDLNDGGKGYVKWTPETATTLIPFPHSRLDFLAFHANRSVMIRLSQNDDCRIDFTSNAVAVGGQGFDTHFAKVGRDPSEGVGSGYQTFYHGTSGSPLAAIAHSCRRHSDLLHHYSALIAPSAPPLPGTVSHSVQWHAEVVVILTEQALYFTERTGRVVRRLLLSQIQHFLLPAGGIGDRSASARSASTTSATVELQQQLDDIAAFIIGDNDVILLRSKYVQDIAGRLRQRLRSGSSAMTNTTTNTTMVSAHPSLADIAAGGGGCSMSQQRHSSPPIPTATAPAIPIPTTTSSSSPGPPSVPRLRRMPTPGDDDGNGGGVDSTTTTTLSPPPRGGGRGGSSCTTAPPLGGGGSPTRKQMSPANSRAAPAGGGAPSGTTTRLSHRQLSAGGGGGATNGVDGVPEDQVFDRTAQWTAEAHHPGGNVDIEHHQRREAEAEVVGSSSAAALPPLPTDVPPRGRSVSSQQQAAPTTTTTTAATGSSGMKLRAPSAQREGSTEVITLLDDDLVDNEAQHRHRAASAARSNTTTAAAEEDDSPMTIGSQAATYVLQNRVNELAETVTHREVTIRLLQQRCSQLALEYGAISGGGAAEMAAPSGASTPRSGAVGARGGGGSRPPSPGASRRGGGTAPTTPRSHVGTPRGTTSRTAKGAANADGMIVSAADSKQQKQLQIANQKEVEILRHYVALLEEQIGTEQAKKAPERLLKLEQQMCSAVLNNTGSIAGHTSVDTTAGSNSNATITALRYALEEAVQKEQYYQNKLRRTQQEHRAVNDATNASLNEMGVKVSNAIQDFVMSYHHEQRQQVAATHVNTDEEKYARMPWGEFTRCVEDVEMVVQQEVAKRTDDVVRSNAALVQELRARESEVDSLMEQVLSPQGLAQPLGTLQQLRSNVDELTSKKAALEVTVRSLSRQIDDLSEARRVLAQDDPPSVEDAIARKDPHSIQNATTHSLHQQIAALQKLNNVPLLVSRIASLELHAADRDAAKEEALSKMETAKEMHHQLQLSKDHLSRSKEEISQLQRQLLESEGSQRDSASEIARLQEILINLKEEKESNEKGFKKQLRYQKDRIHDLLQAAKKASSTAHDNKVVDVSGVVGDTSLLSNQHDPVTGGAHLGKTSTRGTTPHRVSERMPQHRRNTTATSVSPTPRGVGGGGGDTTTMTTSRTHTPRRAATGGGGVRDQRVQQAETALAELSLQHPDWDMEEGDASFLGDTTTGAVATNSGGGDAAATSRRLTALHQENEILNQRLAQQEERFEARLMDVMHSVQSMQYNNQQQPPPPPTQQQHMGMGAISSSPQPSFSPQQQRQPSASSQHPQDLPHSLPRLSSSSPQQQHQQQSLSISPAPQQQQQRRVSGEDAASAFGVVRDTADVMGGYTPDDELKQLAAQQQWIDTDRRRAQAEADATRRQVAKVLRPTAAGASAPTSAARSSPATGTRPGAASASAARRNPTTTTTTTSGGASSRRPQNPNYVPRAASSSRSQSLRRSASRESVDHAYGSDLAGEAAAVEDARRRYEALRVKLGAHNA